MAKLSLPPSLAVSPNIPFHEQSIEELKAEYSYWDRIIKQVTHPGAAVSAANEYRALCGDWIARRERENEEIRNVHGR